MKNINKLRERSLLQILFDEKKITNEQIELVNEEINTSGETILETLLNCDYISEREVAKSIVKHYHLPFIYLEDYSPDPDAMELLDRTFLHAHQICPLDVFGNVLVMATSGNITPEIVMEIEQLTEKELALYVSTHSLLLKLLKTEFSLDELASEVSSRMDELFGSS